MNSPLYKTLGENGIPDKFVSKYMEERPPKLDVPTAEKKDLFLTLPFLGDRASEILHRRLNSAIARIYPATEIRLVFLSTSLLLLEGKERLPFQTSSMCIYAFACSCEACYIGRTTRCLSKRMREHHPFWLNQGTVIYIFSVIVAHLVDNGPVALDHLHPPHAPITVATTTCPTSVTTVTTSNYLPPDTSSFSFSSTTTTVPSTSDGDAVLTCPHGDRQFTPHIGLLRHLRTHRTVTGEPVS
ncbi:unnamed protein product [Schistocephalus solidus]|uniref:C2H2-type domain-containing protein n=1 Tax=Schistocephalus solidus TaxID=70667 RepID=A0A183SMI9_SCHSO|nr:unnamed protein product [Schistocephalus solidus]